MRTRCDSTPDLVDRIFGKISTVRLTSLILLTFLHSNLLTVELDGEELVDNQWSEACAFAALSADARPHPENNWTNKNYSWKWCKILSSVETFFSVVGLSAYIAAMTIGPAEGLSNRKVTNRFVTFSRLYGPRPLPTSPHLSYVPPDFFVLPSTSFVSENTRNVSGRPDEFLEKVSPLCVIKENFPFILGTFAHIFPDIMDRLTGLSNVSNQPNHSVIVSSDSAMSIQDELKAFAASLKAGIQRYAFPEVEQVLRGQSEGRFLDLSRVCAPEVLLSGVMSEDVVSPERVRTVMQHQRLSQPWLRSLLGLSVTRDKLGLFRADAGGFEECTLDRTTGSGVIQCIRIALGITVATDEELGIHPTFSFRETVSKPLLEADDEVGVLESDDEVGGKRALNVGREMRSNKKARKADDEYHVFSTMKPRLYRYKEVNFCTLENRNLHPAHTNIIEPDVTYYVKYLLEDQGALFGRSTRVWCVYKQVSDEERGKYAQENGAIKTAPIFVGPFALKMYNADLNSEAYKYDLVQKAVEANVRHVVLPKHVWYLGRVLQDLRSGRYMPSHGCESDDREEIMMISPFKRTLAQFSDADEFYRGIIDALKGIESLESAGLMHCDVSIGNILLEAETCAMPKEGIDLATYLVDGTADTEIALLVQPSGSDGGLHDLDLMERVPTNQQSHGGEEKFNRVGTLPFMSIECMGGKRHTVLDDMHSLFYVLYISMFQLAGPVRNIYPSAPKQVDFEYPNEVKRWAAADESAVLHAWTKDQLYAYAREIKSLFFEMKFGYLRFPPWYTTAATQSLPFWRNNFAVHRVFLAAFHENLWFRAYLNRSDTIWARRDISPKSLIDQLEKYEGALKDILEGLQ